MGEVKLCLFADDTIFYIKTLMTSQNKNKKTNKKDFTKKLLELINKYSKVAVYKINI